MGGQGSVTSGTSGTPGGWNGGGLGGSGYGASGGGATDIRIGGTSLANRVIVAGGGGGGTYVAGSGGAGGSGGGGNGASTGTSTNGFAGTANTGGGGGGAFKRPEATPPPDLKGPEHCGQPMIYKPGYDKPDGGKVNAKFTCRADKECAVVKAGGQWPATEWEDALRRKLRSAAPRSDDFPTDEDYA